MWVGYIVTHDEVPNAYTLESDWTSTWYMVDWIMFDSWYWFDNFISCV